MCGIFGWIKPTIKTETNLDLVKIFEKGLIETQIRGTDATGYYAPNLGIVKEAITATEFVKRGRVIAELANERFVLGHDRAASSNTTPESRTKDINAHPFESKDWIIIHNGTVRMPKIANYKYTSEDVDSEVILSYIQRQGIKNAIKNMNGSATIVLYNKTIKKIYFWTDDNRPLAIGYCHNMIFFASTKSLLKKALDIKSDFGLFPQVSFGTIYEFELLEFDLAKNKFIRKGEIKPKEDDVDWAAAPTKVVSTKVTSLQRGCTVNPTGKVVRISANNPYSQYDGSEPETHLSHNIIPAQRSLFDMNS